MAGLAPGSSNPTFAQLGPLANWLTSPVGGASPTNPASPNYSINTTAIQGNTPEVPIAQATQNEAVGIIHAVQSGQGTPAQTKMVQQWLAKQGYQISVDGQVGPQTIGAIHAYLNKIGPTAFNHSQTMVEPVEPPIKHLPMQPAGGYQLTGGKTDIGGGLAQSKSTTGAGSSGGDNISSNENVYNNVPAWLNTDINKVTQSLMGGSTATPGALSLANIAKLVPNLQVNPSTQANNLANQQFGAPISSLQQQIAQTGLQNNQDLKDIAGWYSQLLTNANARNAQTITGDQNAQTQTNDFNNQMANALGFAPGSAGAAGIDTAGSIFGALANQTTADQRNTNTDFINTVKAGGAQDYQNQMNLNAQNLAALQAQLQGLQSERGSAYANAFTQAQQQNASNAQNRVSDLTALNNAYAGQQSNKFNQGAALLNTLTAQQANDIQAGANSAYINYYNSLASKNAAQIPLYNAETAKYLAQTSEVPSQITKNLASAASSNADVKARLAAAGYDTAKTKALGGSAAISTGLKAMHSAVTTQPNLSAQSLAYIGIASLGPKATAQQKEALLVAAGYSTANARQAALALAGV